MILRRLATLYLIAAIIFTLLCCCAQLSRLFAVFINPYRLDGLLTAVGFVFAVNLD